METIAFAVFVGIICWLGREKDSPIIPAVVLAGFGAVGAMFVSVLGLIAYNAITR